jgi:formylglycine-generating enzyme required for sulfatase activity
MLRILAVIAPVALAAAIPLVAAEHCDSGISAARRGRSGSSKTGPKMVWIRGGEFSMGSIVASAPLEAGKARMCSISLRTRPACRKTLCPDDRLGPA